MGYSAPTQSAIREDLNLSIAQVLISILQFLLNPCLELHKIVNKISIFSWQYSTFGSIVTIGAMLGAITSGRIADFIGRKGV